MSLRLLGSQDYPDLSVEWLRGSLCIEKLRDVVKFHVLILVKIFRLTRRKTGQMSSDGNVSYSYLVSRTC